MSGCNYWKILRMGGMSTLLERIAQEATEAPQGVVTGETSPTSNGYRNGAHGLSGTSRERRSNSLHIEELTVAELPPPKPLRKRKRPKILCRTTRPTDEQAQCFDDLVELLEREGYDFCRSELERTMYQMFLDLDLRSVVLAAQRNREQEQVGGYGIGYM